MELWTDPTVPEIPLRVGTLRAAIAGHPRLRIAEACRVDPSTVSRWQNGTRTPKLEHLPAIERATGLRFMIAVQDDAGRADRRAFDQARDEARRHGVA